jgi:hypothetical protein
MRTAHGKSPRTKGGEEMKNEHPTTSRAINGRDQNEIVERNERTPLNFCMQIIFEILFDYMKSSV